MTTKAYRGRYLIIAHMLNLVEEIPHHFSGNKKFVYKITEKGHHLLKVSKEIESIVGLD